MAKLSFYLFVFAMPQNPLVWFLFGCAVPNTPNSITNYLFNYLRRWLLLNLNFELKNYWTKASDKGWNCWLSLILLTSLGLTTFSKTFGLNIDFPSLPGRSILKGLWSTFSEHEGGVLWWGSNEKVLENNRFSSTLLCLVKVLGFPLAFSIAELIMVLDRRLSFLTVEILCCTGVFSYFNLLVGWNLEHTTGFKDGVVTDVK